MDKTALVSELNIAFQKIESNGVQLDCVYLIPATTLFRNESYVVVVGTPSFKAYGMRDKIAAVSRKLDNYITLEVRRHIQMIWVFDDAEQARRRIDLEDVDEFITPVIEPAHA
ncbi:hypothetical protein [Spirosoma koreense]